MRGIPFALKCFLQKTRSELMFWTSSPKLKVKPLLSLSFLGGADLEFSAKRHQGKDWI